MAILNLGNIKTSSVASDGQKIYIVGFRNSKDIDVAFEDGHVVYHTTYKKYLKGDV